MALCQVKEAILQSYILYEPDPQIKINTDGEIIGVNQGFEIEVGCDYNSISKRAYLNDEALLYPDCGVYTNLLLILKFTELYTPSPQNQSCCVEIYQTNKKHIWSPSQI